ncbi:MAG: Coenzyme F420 hydrogenase/dehydrogenase, beta subunit C-terminal domain [Candidatus Aminicenantes bacterium]|nr:Coenzyme F420 hydrogenase/dehydrogenase, beta subunit C-terminal domain [Candidatus Aminicenantes bacterium]
MSNALKIPESTENGLRTYFEFLLSGNKVEGIFTLRKMNEKGAVSYSLITDIDDLKNAVPLYPKMPVNAGQVLSSFTLQGPAQKPVAAVLRPCELRAFIELVKRNQGSLDNILLISLTCGGVLSLKSRQEKTGGDELSSYWESVIKAEAAPGIRDTCETCEEFVPGNADLVVATVGQKDFKATCTIFPTSTRGEEYIQNAPGSVVSEEMDSEGIQAIREKRKERKQGLRETFDKTQRGLKSLIETFAPCLGCHGCRHACPICYCTLCDFDSKTFEYQPVSVRSELKQKGGFKIPPGNLLFHLGRMSHMAVSCVSCGMCSDVCPVNIPVAFYFSTVGASLEKVFDYVPGKNVEDLVPSGTHKEQEFVEIGEA